MTTIFTRKTALLSAALLLATQSALVGAKTAAPAAKPVYSDAIFSENAIHQPVWAANGMVASQQEQASQVGLEILQQGGNAVDAAVAVGFALAVTLPRAGNIGGGGFMMIYDAKTGETIALDYREMAPAKAFRDMYLDEAGNAVEEKSRALV